jgi:hypothetical protein
MDVDLMTPCTKAAGKRIDFPFNAARSSVVVVRERDPHGRTLARRRPAAARIEIRSVYGKMGMNMKKANVTAAYASA